jgi:nitronate monooxygenase
MSVLERVDVPIVLAPLAGGPSTPELAAAVSEAGGLGFVAAGYLSADALRERIAALRELTAKPFGVNLFVPGPPSSRETYESYVGGMGEPRYHDDDWAAKLDAVAELAPDVVSFTFGCPSREELARVGEAWVTVTTPEEASVALEAGADGLVVQGAEAGGHRGVFEDSPDVTQYGLLPLLQLIRADVPLIATGGIATGAGVAAVLAAGAAAAQLGSAFLLAQEAGTAPAHREALATTRGTALTRAFTGRLARGIRNRFMDEHPDAPIAYPEIHYATAGMRAEARKRGDAEAINLWAGEAHALAREKPAAEIVAELAAGAREALAAAERRLGGAG